MRDIAAIEIRVIVRELGDLVSARFKNFYELKDGSFLLALSKERKETLVYIKLTKTINKTEFKEKTEMPTDFALQVRKRLEGCTVGSVEQHGSDRIAVMGFFGKNAVRLVVEMFDKGNLLLVNESGLIDLAYRSRSYRDRSVRKNSSYAFPRSDALIFEALDAEKVQEIVKAVGKSDQKLIVALAKYLNFGPLYLEETIRRSGLDANKKASAQEPVRTNMRNEILALLESSEDPEPRAYYKNSDYVDFAIMPISKYEREPEVKETVFGTMSELLEKIYFKERTTEMDASKIKEMEELSVSMDKLHAQVEDLKTKSEGYRKIANKIFERAGEINALIDRANKNKVRSIRDIGSGSDNIKVKSVDLKRKTITIDLD